MTCVKRAEMRLRFPRNLTMFSTRMGGEKSGFQVTYTSSFIQDKPIRGDAFPAFLLEERVTENYIDGHNIDFLEGSNCI